MLGEAVNVYNPLTQERLAALTQTFTAAGSDTVTAGQQALASLDALVRPEATIMAFNDCFLVLGLVLIGTVMVALLCRSVKGKTSGAAH